MTTILFIIVVVISILSQAYVGRAYRKAKKIKIKYDKEGYKIANEILDKNKIEGIKVLKTDGKIANHYNTSKKIIGLSKEVYSNKTVASMAVAAHECGHAIQAENGYIFLKVRNMLSPLLNITSSISYILVLVGLVLKSDSLFNTGAIILFCILLFHILSMPMETSASSFGIQQLIKYDFINENEIKSCRRMMRASALAYVSSLAAPFIHFYRIVVIAIKYY